MLKLFLATAAEIPCSLLSHAQERLSVPIKSTPILSIH